MIIAVCLQKLPEKLTYSSKEFIFQTLQEITKQHPDNQFLFLSDNSPDTGFISSSNIDWIIINKASDNRLKNYWKQWKIPLILKKTKADVVVSFDDNCSVSAATPHCLIILKDEKLNSNYLRKAKSIAVLSEKVRINITCQFQLPDKKVDVCYAFAGKNYEPLSPGEKEKIKKTVCDSKEFFLFTGVMKNRENFINILKAFSWFKKRQQSNMQLLIHSTPPGLYKKDFEMYKYRHDVKILDRQTDMEKITASAYAVIHPYTNEDSMIKGLQAMQCGVPLIVFEDSVIKEVADECALYAGSGNFKELSEKMMRIYTDENLHSQLSEKGKAIAGNFTTQRTADLLWESINKALK